MVNNVNMEKSEINRTYSEIMKDWLPKDSQKELISDGELELLEDFITFMDNSFHKPKEK